MDGRSPGGDSQLCPTVGEKVFAEHEGEDVGLEARGAPLYTLGRAQAAAS